MIFDQEMSILVGERGFGSARQCSFPDLTKVDMLTDVCVVRLARRRADAAQEVVLQKST